MIPISLRQKEIFHNIKRNHTVNNTDKTTRKAGYINSTNGPNLSQCGKLSENLTHQLQKAQHPNRNYCYLECKLLIHIGLFCNFGVSKKLAHNVLTI